MYWTMVKRRLWNIMLATAWFLFWDNWPWPNTTRHWPPVTNVSGTCLLVHHKKKKKKKEKTTFLPSVELYLSGTGGCMSVWEGRGSIQQEQLSSIYNRDSNVSCMMGSYAAGISNTHVPLHLSFYYLPTSKSGCFLSLPSRCWTWRAISLCFYV